MSWNLKPDMTGFTIANTSPYVHFDNPVVAPAAKAAETSAPNYKGIVVVVVVIIVLLMLFR